MTTAHGTRTRDAILDAGLRLWRSDPGKVSARRIGKWCDMTHAGVLYHFGTSAALYDALAIEAVRLRDATIVPQLIVARHPAADSLTDVERSRYLAAVG